MDKKKTIVVIAAVAVLAVAGIGGGILLHNKNKGNVALESSVDSGLDTTDFQLALDNVIKVNDEENQVPLFLSSMDDACTFDVLSVSEAEDGFYLAKVDVSYADVSAEIKEYISSLPAEQLDIEKLNKDVSEIVGNATIAKEEVEIYFISDNDTYKPIFSEDIIDKMYGGIYSAYYEQLEKLSSELKGGEQ